MAIIVPIISGDVLTLQDAYDTFARYKKDISDVDEDTFIDWCNFITNFIYRKLIATDPERFYSEQIVTAVAGTNVEVDLPVGFRDIAEYKAGLWRLDRENRPTDNQLPRTGYASTSMGYYLYQDKIRFTPIQLGPTISYMFRWVPKRTSFTALSDCFTITTLEDGVVIIPAEYLEHIIRALDVLYTQWDQDPSSEMIADQRFVRTLSEIIADIKREPLVYDVGNPSEAF